MDTYQIIDEPKSNAYQNLVVPPVVILFASLLIPIFIDLPLYGRLWMPLVWITINGFLLGSPTKIKEMLIAIGGLVVLALSFFALIILGNTDEQLMTNVLPYFRITIQGILFFTLYLVVFYQSVAYSIHEYLKEHN